MRLVVFAAPVETVDPEREAAVALGDRVQNLDARVQRATASENAGSGVAAEQAAPGAGTLRVQALTAAGNGDGEVTADVSVTLVLVPATP